MTAFNKVVPAWIIQSIVAVLLSALLGWGTWATTSINGHSATLSAAKQKADDTDNDIKDIKQGVRDLNQKVDRLIERGK